MRRGAWADGDGAAVAAGPLLQAIGRRTRDAGVRGGGWGWKTTRKWIPASRDKVERTETVKDGRWDYVPHTHATTTTAPPTTQSYPPPDYSSRRTTPSTTPTERRRTSTRSATTTTQYYSPPVPGRYCWDGSYTTSGCPPKRSTTTTTTTTTTTPPRSNSHYDDDGTYQGVKHKVLGYTPCGSTTATTGSSRDTCARLSSTAPKDCPAGTSRVQLTTGNWGCGNRGDKLCKTGGRDPVTKKCKGHEITIPTACQGGSSSGQGSYSAPWHPVMAGR